jgi:hypothetical protein
MREIKAAFVAGMLAIVFPALAHADLDISGHADRYAGTTFLSYAGGSAPLVGSATVDRVGSIACIGCFLNFQTGSDLSITTYDSQSGLGRFVAGTFDDGGQISITGQLAGFNTTTNLFSGFFAAPVDVSESSQAFHLASPVTYPLPIVLTAYSDVASALNLPGMSGIGLVDFTLWKGLNGQITIVNLDGSFITSGGHDLDIGFAPTPEPTSVFLLGTLLIGCGFIVKRRVLKR